MRASVLVPGAREKLQRPRTDRRAACLAHTTVADRALELLLRKQLMTVTSCGASSLDRLAVTDHARPTLSQTPSL
jgi:hypothetical protein